MLLFIPSFLGVAHVTSHEVAGITAIQVFFATITGVWAYRKSGLLNRTLILYMGISILIGSFIGGFSSSHLNETTVNVIYGILAIIAVILMFIPKKVIDDASFEELTLNKWLAALLSFVVGSAAGGVGAGGAFLLVPIMLVVLKIPTRITIASSLAITFISSIGTAIGKISTGQVSYVPALIMVIASLIASPLGVKLGKKMNTKTLRSILGMIISITALKIWISIL